MITTAAYREKRDKQNERQNQTLADLADRLFPEKEKSVVGKKPKPAKASKEVKKIS